MTSKATRDARHAEGLCVYCGLEEHRPGKLGCKGCMEDRNRKARSLYTTYTKRNRCKCGKPRLKGRCRCRECYRRLGLSKEVPPLLVQIMAHLDGAALKVMGASEKLQHINAIHGGDKFQALSLLTDELSKEISRVSKAIMEMPELNDGKL